MATRKILSLWTGTVGYTSSKPTTLVSLVCWAPCCWCPGWPIVSPAKLPSSRRVPSTRSKGHLWDQPSFLLTFGLSRVFALQQWFSSSHGFTRRWKHYQISFLFTDLTVYSVQVNICYCTLGIPWEKASQVLRAWNTDLTCTGESACLPSGGLGRVVNEIPTYPTT